MKLKIHLSYKLKKKEKKTQPNYIVNDDLPTRGVIAEVKTELL